MLHLIIINYEYNPASTNANEWLNHANPLTSWTEELQAAGVQVTLFQRFLQDDVIKRNNINYHLVKDTFAARLRAWQIPRQIHWSARVLCRAHVQVEHSTLVQVNGLNFPLQIRYLRSLLPSACPLVVQHQGEEPWSAPYYPLQRWGLQVVDGFLFSNLALAEAWATTKITNSQQKIYPLALDTAARPMSNLGNQALAAYTAILRSHKEAINQP